MKVLGINGSARKDGNTAILLNLVFDELKSQGIETEMIQMAGEVIPGCIACYRCQKNKDKKCAVAGDQFNEYLARMENAQGILLGSPVYVSDVTANMKALLERGALVSRANGDMLRRKPAAGVLAVRRAGAVHAFSTLNYFFTINQMVLVGSSYWNLGIGRNIGDVKNDAEGIGTMKNLGQNMAWLLKKVYG
jgi:multimeric flavodoxin WrbA